MPTGMSDDRNTPWWLPRSLRHQLLLGVLVVVRVVLATVGVVSVLSLRGYVTAMGDAEVANPCTHSVTHITDTTTASTPRRMPHPADRARQCWSSPDDAGNLIAVVHDGVVVGSAVFSEDEPPPRSRCHPRDRGAAGSTGRPAPTDSAASAPTGLTAASRGPTGWSSGCWPDARRPDHRPQVHHHQRSW